MDITKFSVVISNKSVFLATILVISDEQYNNTCGCCYTYLYEILSNVQLSLYYINKCEQYKEEKLGPRINENGATQ